MKNSSKKNFIYNLVYQLFVLITPLITAPYISRIFGPDGVGVYSFNYSIATYFVYFCLLGINNYGVREIAKCKTAEERNATFSSVYFTQFIVSSVTLAVYLVYLLSFNIDDKIVAICFIPYVVSGMIDINWYFFGTERFFATTIRNCIVKTLMIAGVFIFIKTKEDLWIYCLIVSLAALLTQLIMWITFFRVGKITKPDLKLFPKHLKGLIVLFVPVLAVSLYRIMDKIMLGFFSTKDFVGYYENAEQIIGVPGTVTTALGTAMLPRMTNMLATKENNQFDNLFKKSVLFVEFICFPMAFGILAVSDTFVPLYYGQEFEQSSVVLKILCISYVFSSLASVLRTQYLIPKNKDKIYIGSVISGAVVNLAANTILIPFFDAVGAAIGTVIANIVVALYQFFFVIREYKNVKCYSRGLPFILFGSAMFAIVAVASHFIPLNGLVLLLIQVLIGVVSYSLLSIPFLLYEKRKYKNET